MFNNWDIEVISKNGDLILTIELKNRLGMTNFWAAKLRRNLLAHGVFPLTPFFMIILPDKFFLWINSEANEEIIEPHYEVDAIPLLKPYLDEAGFHIDELSRQSFELIVNSWLVDFINSDGNTKLQVEKPRWAIESGILNAVANGHILFEARR